MKSLLVGTIVICAILRCADLKLQYNTYGPQISKSTQYEPKVVLKSCLLKPDEGPCRGKIPMYYYDPEEKKCTKFLWGGCMGNGNRFDTKAECKSTCLSKPNEKIERPKYCSLSFDYGYCFGAEKRWYYDRLWQVCKETIYSGCGGNKNNFEDKDKCDRMCRLALGRLHKKSKAKDGIRKVLIINPLGATKARRGKNQGENQTVYNMTIIYNYTYTSTPVNTTFSTTKLQPSIKTSPNGGFYYG